MSGDIAKSGFCDVAKENGAILIVDEAHSSGVIGENLLGYFDYYNIKIEPNFIKMGTLGKAYGSYGAYILANSSIIDFLQNRAKSIIYTTAPSLFCVELARQNLLYIQKKMIQFKKRLKKLRGIVDSFFEKDRFCKLHSSIFVVEFGSIEKMIKTSEILKKHGYVVGAIRPPTTKKPILRITISAKRSKKDVAKVCKIVKTHRD